MVELAGSSWHQTNRGVSIFIAIYLFLLITVIGLSKVLHSRPKIGSYLPEAALVILVGMIVGFVIHFTAAGGDNVASSLLGFSPQVFFIVLLPPIIFNSGYHLQRDLFFRYITPICLYACLGTVICTAVMSLWLYMLSPFYSFTPSLLELMAFSALISATDPVSTLAVFSDKKVDPHLFYLVFGDSSVNDAVSLVLFDSLSHLIDSNITNVGSEIRQFLFDFSTGFVGSIGLGILIGLGYALFLKTFDFRHVPLLELCLFSTVVYFPFVIAEVFHLSGIVTVLMTGIVSKRYAEPNLSADTAKSADVIFRLLAHLTETIIFLELGLSVAELVGLKGFHIMFLAASLIGCLIGRAANVYPITWAYNLCSRRMDKAQGSLVYDGYRVHDDIEGEMSKGVASNKVEKTLDDSIISWNKAHMLWFSGLRGAVSYGLVRMFPETQNKAIYVATTMTVVLVTTFVLGGATEWALHILKIDVGVDEKLYMESIGKRKLLMGHLARFESTTLRQWVVRDSDCAKHRKDEDGDYIEHIEMTMRDHDEIVKRQARPVSVYDYGQ